MRSIWSGLLTFGLVNIPVRLYSATGGASLDFDMLHKKDLSPIRFARVCKEEEKEVPYSEIVKGYEYEKGEYVVMSDEDFKKVDVHKTKSIDVLDFVKEEDIDSLFYEKPYFLEPGKGADKAYALFREALKKSKKVGVATFVIRNRQHLGAVKQFMNAIILDQMRFVSDLQKPVNLNLPKSDIVGEREMDMALKLIDQSTNAFNPAHYRDTYNEELKKLIEQKAKGERIKIKGEEPSATRVSDLMATLRASLKQSRAHDSR